MSGGITVIISVLVQRRPVLHSSIFFEKLYASLSFTCGCMAGQAHGRGGGDIFPFGSVPDAGAVPDTGSVPE
jgi:hypothetical protein